VLVADLTGDAEGCRLSKPPLQAGAIAVLTRHGLGATISEKASSWFYTVFVRTESVATAGRCVTALRTFLGTQVDGIPEVDRYATAGEWGSLLVGQLPLIDASALVESSAQDHPERVQAALRDQLTAIGARVAAANK
jgi:hypothetical protein